VDLTVLTNWDTFSEAYDIQANIGALAQVSGDPDGLCDASPETVLGNFTLAADQGLVLGPIKFPAGGIFWVHDFTAIATDYRFLFQLEQPWDSAGMTFTGTATDTSLTPEGYVFGPGPVGVSSYLNAADQLPFPAANIYIVLDLDGVGDFDFNVGMVSLRADQYGKD
jgi:hypothetical protein